MWGSLVNCQAMELGCGEKIMVQRLKRVLYPRPYNKLLTFIQLPSYPELKIFPAGTNNDLFYMDIDSRSR